LYNFQRLDKLNYRLKSFSARSAICAGEQSMFRGIQKSNIRVPLAALAMLMAETGHAQSAGQIGAVTPVAALATDDPIRHAAQPVGLLRAELNGGSVRTCTTAIISDRYILTAAHCTVDALRLTAIFGQGGETAAFPVLTAPVEIDHMRGYAVLEVNGVPSQRFSVAKLLLRIPLKGESAFVLSMNDNGGQTISRNCSVLETNDRGLVRHDCDTTAGSSGALLFSAYDLAILGLHIGSADARSNQASAMYSIALASDLVRNIATIRPSTTPIIDFRTVGDKPGEIASDFKRLYLSLHNDGRLPLKQYQVSSFGGIEDAFRTNQLFYGSPFPVELDSIACDVNPNVCTRDRTEPSLEELKLGPYIRDVIPFAGRPSGKSRPSSGKWSVAPSTLLWLPSIRFEQQRGWVVYRKRAGQEIGEIVQGFGVCNQFDDQCKNLILGMNRNQDERLTRDYAGTVLLPKVTYSARDIDISTASEKGAGRAIEIKPVSSEQAAPLILRAGEAATGKTPRPSDSDFRVVHVPAESSVSTGLDGVLKSLGSTASGSTRIQPKSAWQPHCNGSEASPCELDPIDFSELQKRFLDGVNFPYRTLADFPTAVRTKSKRLGVIDTSLELGHCAFEHLRTANRLKLIGDTIVAEPAPMAFGHAPCKWMMPYRQIGPGIHGTHVAGLMVGKISDQSWGLNPFATLFAGQITPTTIGQQEKVSNLQLAELLGKMLDEAGLAGGLDVVNLSMFYQKESIAPAGPGGADNRPRGDPVLDVIQSGAGYETLFVVAAGNDGEDFTAICDMRPACLDLPNVISVAALDGKIAGLLAGDAGGSNYGGRVHVAAPGADILGVINGNYLGLLSGTSQAAPQVAAIASILRTIKPHASPGDIKERLIVCSQPVPAPPGAPNATANAIFGGRVDATCTLRSDGEGMLREKNSNEIFRVRSVVAAAQPDIGFDPVVSDYNYHVVIPPKQLRGLRDSSNPDEFTIFYKRSPENSSASLSKDERMSVQAGAQLRVEVWEETPPAPGAWTLRTFSVGNIARFVAPMLNR
jgi:hypothetical protein